MKCAVADILNKELTYIALSSGFYLFFFFALLKLDLIVLLSELRFNAKSRFRLLESWLLAQLVSYQSTPRAVGAR